MGRIIKRIVFFIAAFNCLITKAQDSHFSQYFNTPLFVNPANAGNGIEYMRATLIYRNQWAGISNPFITEGFLIDKKVNRLGFGLMAVKNSAGKSSFKQLQLSGVLNYNQPIGENNQLSGALQIGMLHKNFDPSQMTFDNQFTEDAGFDPTLSSGEVFTYTSISRPDVGFGIMWQRGFANKKLRFKPFGGFSIAHINKPSESFILSENKLPVKSIFNFGAGIQLKDNLELRPSLLYAIQDHFHELNFGAVASFVMENNNKFQVGLYDRSNDALIIYAGYQINRMFIGTSYDVNMSGLKDASHGNGGFEITLSFIPKAPAKTLVPKPKKPVVSKAKPKVQKAEKKISVTPVEQTVSIPEKLEVVPINPVIEKPVVVAQPKEHPAIAKAAPVTKEQPVIEKQKALVKESKVETKTDVKEVVPANTETKSVEAQEINLVVEKQMEPAPKTEEAPVEFSNNTHQPIIEKKSPAIPEKEIVTPKAKTVFIDLTKPAVELEAKNLSENKIADTDGDAIPDKEDHCPFIKGGIKTQGCPDSDGDGIIDMMDECPMEPGTAAHFGCPEKTLPVNEAMLVKKFNNIQFKTGSSKIKTEDMFDIVEYAIDLLYKYPNTRVILSGHTDSEGNDLYNMNLSEKRNLIVKNYLVKKGIKESRIQLINYGETMPLDNNITPTGRAKNRRVELNIIKY